MRVMKPMTAGIPHGITPFIEHECLKAFLMSEMMTWDEYARFKAKKSLIISFLEVKLL